MYLEKRKSSPFLSLEVEAGDDVVISSQGQMFALFAQFVLFVLFACLLSGAPHPVPDWPPACVAGGK